MDRHHQAAQNIPYVAHLGDITNDGDNAPAQWMNAQNALYVLETAPADIAYGAALGNHDQIGGTTQYNTAFGATHFASRSYYGGHYGTNNNNHYDLFSAGGMDFIVIYVENGGPSDVNILNWASGLLQTHSNRRGIVILHDLLTTSNAFSTQGTTLYNALRGNANLFLMMEVTWTPRAAARKPITATQCTACVPIIKPDPTAATAGCAC